MPHCSAASLACALWHPPLRRTAASRSVASLERMRGGCAGQKPVLKSKQGAFQIVNSVEMFKPLSKFTKQARGTLGFRVVCRV